ncbi:hypothetical protein L288_18555 [Sphingobium quisquiliarum P25]|uniref:Integrase DNA-binding domain-containing protein n=1 Tax=Sphingobium quisquiliarum P25 TaxID=1329909 RepID=T0HLP0_9SPHN|nr:hypothetical protein L288_18555 [Sphingobium quisquiliarum P25]
MEALKPTGKRYAVHDAHCPGLSVRVNANGTKTFTASYRYGRKQRRLTIGRYPIISLAEARDKARAAYREVLEGVDPQAVRRRKNMNLREGVDAFIEQYAKPRNRSWRETERVLTRELVTRFGERDLTLTAHMPTSWFGGWPSWCRSRGFGLRWPSLSAAMRAQARARWDAP